MGIGDSTQSKMKTELLKSTKLQTPYGALLLLNFTLYFIVWECSLYWHLGPVIQNRGLYARSTTQVIYGREKLRKKDKPGKWRYLLLVFDCWLGFGSYYNIDVPVALQADIQGEQKDCFNVTVNSTCCEECLGLGPFRYNQLFSIFFWTKAVCALPGGFVIDRLGNKGLIFSAMTTIGTLMFTVSTFSGVRRTSAMVPLMFCGRLLLGAGTVVQQRFVYFWFKDKTTLAIGFVFFTLGLSKVATFLVTANVQEVMGITFSLWIGTLACASGFLTAIALFVMDYSGTRRLDSESQSKSQPVPFNFRDVSRFPGKFWLVCCTVVFFYASYIPLVSNGSKYIQDRQGYSKVEASYFVGAVFDTGVVISAFGGMIFSKLNMGGLSLLVTVLIMVPIYPLMIYFPGIHPLIMTIWIGVCSAAGALFLWPFVMNVVPFRTFGLAGGLVASLQGLGIGFSNFLIGHLLGSREDPDMSIQISRYNHMLLLLMSCTGVTVVLVIVINVIDLAGDRAFNARLARRTRGEGNDEISEDDKSPDSIYTIQENISSDESEPEETVQS